MSIGIALASALSMLGTAIVDDPLGYRVAFVPFMLAVTVMLASRSTINLEILERERQAGWDDGYRAGRRVAKPVVVDRASDLEAM